MPKYTHKKREKRGKGKGGMPTERSTRAARANTTTARPQSRAAAAREVEARARSMIEDYYRPPVIRGNALDDPIIASSRERFIQRIAEHPERERAILQAVDHYRRALYEEDARREATTRAQEARERNRPDPSYDSNLRTAFNRPFREAEEIASRYENMARRDLSRADEELRNAILTQEEINAENARQGYDDYDYDDDFYGEEYVPGVDNNMEVDEVDEEPVDIPAVNIQADCQTDMNSSEEYISGISLEELVAGQTVKLSDGHCYNKDDIVNYYRTKKQQRQPFISPFNRQPFTRQDISIVKTIIRELQNAAPEQGGYKKRKTSKKRGGKKRGGKKSKKSRK